MKQECWLGDAYERECMQKQQIVDEPNNLTQLRNMWLLKQKCKFTVEIHKMNAG